MVLLFARRVTRAERIRARAKIILDDAALTPQTQSRYYHALRKLVPVIEKVKDEQFLDVHICKWIRKMWRTGEPLLTIGDALSALHFHQPWTRRRIPHSWKLFSVWRRIEVPCRAPPFTLRLTRGLAALAVARDQWELAAMLLLGFSCLLRTGELLELMTSDLLLGTNTGICTLRNTKTGKRDKAQEVISIKDTVTLEFLQQFLLWRNAMPTGSDKLWTASAGCFRKQFAKIIQDFGLSHHGFRPYSLRRGGATWTFQTTQSMEETLIRGRWTSGRVARVYISDGLSYLPALRLSDFSAKMLASYFFLNPQDG